MPALHIHDVARIAHESLRSRTSNRAWAEQTEGEREHWRRATQLAFDGATPPFGIEDTIGWGEDERAPFIAIVEACRPFTEE